MQAERERLRGAREGLESWKKWGPYLSERQWGTVREDYSADGDAWNYFTHEQSRSRAYLWGEDGLGGICDDRGLLCFALTLWNGHDPIIKERLFGLTNCEGNHGEDVKEYYFYLDSTPTHSYMKYLYKYPIAAYPYEDLVATNRSRSRCDAEYELIDTGVLDDDAYFDAFVEYAKAGPTDILIKITVANRSDRRACLHVLPTLWFRNTWTNGGARPVLSAGDWGPYRVIHARHTDERYKPFENYQLYCEAADELWFTENDTNNERLFGGTNATPHVKDAFHEYLIARRVGVINPVRMGTKAAAHYMVEVAPRASRVFRLRLKGTAEGPQRSVNLERRPFAAFDAIFRARIAEADEFYASVIPRSLPSDAARVMRQSLAGMLWSKQHYVFDVDNWLRQHRGHPFEGGSCAVRNRQWFHMVNDDIISTPDKWEYPWYASWDLAFHAIALSAVDVDFARAQLELILTGRYQHPNGQMPAHEWNFSDVNPPVQAWASLLVHRMVKTTTGETSVEFLKSIFSTLSLNFTWWINRKDSSGKGLFEGGVLGLDNIGVLDRSADLPSGGHLEQADGTAWMAFFAQNMAEIATEIAEQDPGYQEMAAKYVEHFIWIAASMNAPGIEGMWDERDGFYYDQLRAPDGGTTRLQVRSLAGLLPLCATRVVEPAQRERIPLAMRYLKERVRKMPMLLNAIHPTGERHRGVNDRGIIAVVNHDRLRRILSKMLDEKEFLSPHGIRSLSKFHAEHPYVLWLDGHEYRVEYEPGEARTGMFGGNSNWRGPIWVPMNLLIISALLNYYLYYGPNFQVECPTGSGVMLNLFELAREIGGRLAKLFLRDEEGRRAVFARHPRFQLDPHFKDYIPFHEYFHGETGAGLGASHQTGWTGVIARVIQLFGALDAETFLQTGWQRQPASWNLPRGSSGPDGLA
jgi:hypothetical protein